MPHPVAIITGAGRGIGRATAILLAKLNYRLTLVSRSTDDLSQTQRLCRIKGLSQKKTTLLAHADVCDLDAVQETVRLTIKKFRRVDAFLHCAGLAPLGPIDRLSPRQWHATIDTNLSAAYYYCHALWPVWRKQRGGTAVLVSSVAARDPFTGFAAYGAAKAALNTFGLALAREGAEFGVRVHTIAPGAVETTMLRAVFTTQQIPPEKTLDPANVAAVIAQCLRGDLRFTSGEVIYVHQTA